MTLVLAMTSSSASFGNIEDKEVEECSGMRPEINFIVIVGVVFC